MNKLYFALSIMVFCISSCFSYSVPSQDGGLPDLLPPTSPVRFRLPIPGESIMQDFIIGMDLNNNAENTPDWSCTSSLGVNFPYCYSGHSGTDFILVNGWDGMDKGVPVYATADGVVIAVDDSNYDRCSLDLSFQISCNGNEIVSNFITIQHSNNIYTSYLHIRKHSARVSPGEEVKCGQIIAEVGSSGESAWPHLHFGVYEDNTPRDPYMGWWVGIGENRLPVEECR